MMGMLVLSRLREEEIEIDNGRIRIKIVDIRGDKVRLGIMAPKEMPVHRKEVADQIRAATEQQRHDTGVL